MGWMGFYPRVRTRNRRARFWTCAEVEVCAAGLPWVDSPSADRQGRGWGWWGVNLVLLLLLLRWCCSPYVASPRLRGVAVSRVMLSPPCERAAEPSRASNGQSCFWRGGKPIAYGSVCVSR